ncbi:MAG: sigma-70 family RNA polymerase sigma factor [Helicobacteraceae bacterium]|nr:sigma-70 family RNA polymerase sigma factor [Helicobacteraceae bacterium]
MNLSEEQEIEHLYKSFRKPLFQFISYKVSDAHRAEEILNDVFFKAASSIETLREKTKVQSWLFKIASNLIIDYYRKRKENYVYLNDDMLLSEEVDGETIYDELNCCIETFLCKLPKQYSESLKAVYLDELTQNEYAQKKNIKLSTVKSQIKRGKESMKSFFETCCTFEKDRLNNMSSCTSNSENCIN